MVNLELMIIPVQI